MKRNLIWNVLGIVVLIANLLPIPALAAPSSGNNPEPAEALLDVSTVLPGWFTGSPANSAHATASGNILPDWFAANTPLASPPSSGDLLPGGFTEFNQPLPGPEAAPALGPLQTQIAESLLSVNVYGPAVASLGSPPLFGEVYTAVIRNTSPVTAYSVYLTMTHQTYFLYDNGEALVSDVGPIAITTLAGTGTITWTPSITLDLAPSRAITLSFRLRAACDAESGQQMRVGIRYNAPPDLSSLELNTGGINITTGRGNLVVTKRPAIQNLDSSDFGRPVTWTVEVQNTGLGILYGAVITDTGGISLSQPGGDLVPSVFITSLQINETRAFTVVGTVAACNFTNVARGSWGCGNLAGDATFANPVSSTVSILFSPSIPRVNLQVSSPITFPYCAPLTRTVALTITNTGGPAANFRLDSTLESNSFLDVITPTIGAGWQYDPATGVFQYATGAPTGTLPGPTTAPVTLSFQVRPRSQVCGEGNSQISFEPLFNDICSGELFRASPATVAYEYAQGTSPSMNVSKSGPSIVASGEVFTYQVMVQGTNPANIAGAINITDVLPTQFTLLGAPLASAGSVTVTGQRVNWSYDPPDAPNTFTATLVYTMQAVLTQTQCGASQIVANNVQAVALPNCPGCLQLDDTASVQTAIINNEGILAERGSNGSLSVCGSGLTIFNRFVITGSTIITWTGAGFTDAMGINLGDGGRPLGTPPLEYVPGSLIVTVGITDYTALLTPTFNSNGQMYIDLSPLQAAGVVTQNVTLMLTYTVNITEAMLGGLAELSFNDWSRLFLPNVSNVQGCATNQAFNQVLGLTIRRSDLSVSLAPEILDRCSVNRVTLGVRNNQPGQLASHVVITFTASAAEVRSARIFTFTGDLAPISSSIGVVTSTSGSQGWITFTLPATATLNNSGEILFDVDVDCAETSVWSAGVVNQSQCGLPHGGTTSLSHIYRAPDLILFTTPIEYTVRQREVVWKFFVANNGNLAATNVLVTNTLSGIAVTTYTTDSGVGSITLNGSLPITAPTPAVFTISQLDPNELREVTVTGTVFLCNPLWVDIEAQQDCFGVTCERPQRRITFNTPDPYLLTNNGQTADLPMCDLGLIVFRTKNASPDVTLYQLDITETLRGLLPEAPPYTLTILSASGAVITTTTAFTPERITVNVTDTLLVWKAISAPLGLFDSLAPLSVVAITVPVRTGCVPPHSPQSFAAASAQGPCGNQLGYTENAVTLQTASPDMTVVKDGRGPTGDFGKTVYANPGDTVTWRLSVTNRPTGRSYVAHNVILSDTWPANFDFVTATLDISPSIDLGTRTILWNIGDVQVSNVLTFYITGTLSGLSCQAVTTNTTELRFGCATGCTTSLVPVDYANTDSGPDLEVILSPEPLQTCSGDLPITVRNYGAAAYTNTLTVEIPSGYEYDRLVAATLTPTAIFSTPASSPRFSWDVIPGRVNPAPYYEFTMTLRLLNSATSGQCPVDDGRPVSATLVYANNTLCTPVSQFTATASANLDVLSPTLRILKAPHAQTADVGQRITWTVRLTNTGTGLAENLVVTDVVGSNYDPASILASNGSDGAAPTRLGNVITWTPNTLPVSGTWVVTLSAVLVASGDNRNVVTAAAGCATGCQTALVTDTAYTTLLQQFRKYPAVQTGTVGSLVVFTLTASLPDENALYQRLTLTDSLPAGLGYVASTLSYFYNTGANSAISETPTLSPTWLASGPIVWRLGDLSGTVQINGIITAVIQDVPSNYSGLRLLNVLTMTYTDDNQPYVYTSTSPVDLLEPLLHIGKSYVTPYGCGATMVMTNFNNLSDAGWSELGTWTPTTQGYYQNTNSNTFRRAFAGNPAWTDYSFSFIMRTNDTTGGMGGYIRQNATDTTDTGYAFRWTNTQMELLQRTPNSTLVTVAGGYQVNRWYHVEMRVAQSQIQVFVDGVLRLSANNTTHGQGRVGLLSDNHTQTQFDDVLVTRFGQAGCFVGANDLVTYTLTISNQGQMTGYDLVITDSLPGGMSLVTYTLQSDDITSTIAAEPAPIPGATGVLMWGVNQLRATTPFTSLVHQALTLTVVLQVSPGITANVILANQAALVYDNWLGSTSPTTVTRQYSGGSHSTAVRTVEPALIKSVVPPTATLGTVVTYTIVLPRPIITATIYSAVVTDRLDSRLMLLTVDVSAGSAVQNGNLFTATLGDIPAGEQRSITVTAVLSSPQGAVAGNVITNVAVLSHTSGITSSNRPVFTVTEPSLTLVKASNPPTSNTVSAGYRITYTVAITNRMGVTTNAAFDVAFTDTLPVGLRNTPPAIQGITLNSVPVLLTDYDTNYDPATGILTITFASNFAIPVGGVLAIQYVATVDSDVQAAINLINLAQVTWSSLGGAVPGDRNYGPISGTTNLHTPLVTTLGKTVTPPTTTIGSQVVFTVRVPGTPIGAMLYTVTVTDVVDGRLQIVEVSPPAAVNGQVVTATFATIPTYTQYLIVITATVRDIAPVAEGTPITNVASMNYSNNPTGTIPSGVVTITLTTVSLGDLVWYDYNNNGVWEPGLGEYGIPGVVVQLYRSTQTPGVDTSFLTTTTNINGRYVFTGLAPSGYIVHIPSSEFGAGRPLEYLTSTIPTQINPDTDMNESVDENGIVNAYGVSSGIVTLSVGGEPTSEDVTSIDTATPDSNSNLTLDFGFFARVSLGNHVWYDVNDNSQFDAGEVGVPSVVVELYQDTNGDGVFTPGVDTFISTTTTSGTGYYLFPNLLPGLYPTQTYLVVITTTNFAGAGVLVGYQNSDGTVGGNSDLNEYDHGVVSGTLGTGGFVASTAISLTVGGEPITDGDTNANSNLTLDFGFYRLELGNQVWYDNNDNGMIDAGESGAAGIEVRLYDISGTLIATMTTNTSGFYTFTGLLSGTYSVEIVPPATYTSSTDIASSGNPNNNVDHDDNGVIISTTGAIRGNPATLIPGDSGALNNNAVITATGSTTNPTVDFGLFALVSLGNHVWYDVNDNSQFDAGEVGVPSVVVELYQDTNGNGVFTPGVDTFISTTTTSGTGYYLFPNLLPSLYPTQTYLVVITTTNFAGAGVLVGYQNSDGLVGGNSDLNEYDHGNVVGTLGAGGFVASTAVSLTVGGEPITDGDTNANSNLTLDFGFYRLELGNQVWYDNNDNGMIDAGESGAAGIEVRLYDISGTLIATMTTNAGGFYTFTNLISGTYSVQIVPPATYTSSTDIASSGNPNNNVDHDDNGVLVNINPLSPTIGTNPVTLVPGGPGALGNNGIVTATGTTSNPTLDLGLVPLAPGLVLVKTVEPGQVVRSMPFSYTLRVTNTSQLTFDPLMITDTLPPLFNYVRGTGTPRDPDVIAEPTLVWNNLGPLTPNASIEIVFVVTAAQGITGTYINVATVTGTTPRGIITDTDDVPVVLRDPAVAIQKQLVAADLDPAAPNLVTFTIAITNVGPTVIATLPLLDQYDPYYLAFAWASPPMPDEPQNDGLLTWYDLTAPAPHGFGRDLPPGEAFHFTTVFTVAHDITLTTFNTAVISRAVDTFDNPTNRPTDTVPITNTIPTAVELLYFRVDNVTDQQVRLTWATAVEIDNYGFNLYRADVNDPARAKLIHFEPSALRGPRAGATYIYVDTVPSDGVWWYWLADVDTRGNETRSAQATASVGVNLALPYKVYLPILMKGP